MDNLIPFRNEAWTLGRGWPRQYRAYPFGNLGGLFTGSSERESETQTAAEANRQGKGEDR